MAELFTNNADGVLASVLADDATEIVLEPGGSADRFASPSVGDYQRATLESDAVPGVFEIVRIKERDGDVLTVDRGIEGTAAIEWPAGTRLQARVTAGMLEQLASSGLQPDERDGRQFRTTNGALVVNGRVAPTSYKAVQLAGFHVLQPVQASLDWSYGLADGRMDANMTRESVGASALVRLGDDVPPLWTADTVYEAGAWVSPPTPTGYRYFLELDTDAGAVQSATATPPAFDEFGSCPEALDGAQTVGQWTSVPHPLAFPIKFPGAVRALLSEVGVICYEYDATSAPTISIGTQDDPTRFANAVALTQIAGRNHAHRIPITDGNLVGRLQFTLNTPATGTFLGRMYWRGLLVHNSA